MKIVADAHIPYVRDYFAPCGELILQPGRAISREMVREADMLLVRSITPVNAALLDGSRVKFVGSVTAGADHLDTAWLDAARIQWTVASGFNAPPVADYVVSVIAALQSQQLLANKGMKAAVIGVGNVGRLVVQHLQQLQMEVVLCDPLRAAQESDFVSTPLQALADMDVISLHVPLTKTGLHPTFHFIDKDFLQRQKPGCVLINAARGAVIDSAALMQAGAHLHWCLDVWEQEPDIRQDVLAQAVIATPHIAGYSVQSKRRGIEMIYRLAGEQHVIPAEFSALHAMPMQLLAMNQPLKSWQAVVLAIFDPWRMTESMRRQLLSAPVCGSLFDGMRHDFKDRYELAFSQVPQGLLKAADEKLLHRLGVKIA